MNTGEGIAIGCMWLSVGIATTGTALSSLPVAVAVVGVIGFICALIGTLFIVVE